jgi:hypothetical protein
MVPSLVKWAAALCTCRKECKRSVSDWPIIMIGPGVLRLVVPHLFVVRVSVFMGAVAVHN